MLRAAAACVALSVVSADSSSVWMHKASEVEKVLPKSPKDYPENLQGIIWMDQSGVYGHSDVPMNAPDLALSWGDTEFFRLDKKNRVHKVDCAGPAWQWMNSFLGYSFYFFVKLSGYHYLFEWNEDYTFTQIYPSYDLGWLGTYSVPKFIVSFQMAHQTPPQGACPPAKGASKKEIAKCAKWDRITTGLLSPFFGSWGTIHYYAWEIVDKDGNHVQPAYDIFVSWAANGTSPAPTAAKLFGVDPGSDGFEAGTAFVGRRVKQSSKGAASTEL